MRPSAAETRSTSFFTCSMSSAPSEETTSATPVGPRYSPNTSRSAKPHSPVVTPAFAAAMEAGMMLRFSRAAAFSSSSAVSAAPWSRAARHAFSLAMTSASSLGSTVSIELSPADSGEGSVSVQRLTPTTVMSPVSMRRARSALEATSWAFM